MAARRPPPADRQVSAGGRRRQRPRFVPSSGRRRTDRGGTMGQLATGLLSLSGWAALALLFMLPALEAPAFLGLVLPGELALILGGALAGDSAGYWIGRHWGPPAHLRPGAAGRPGPPPQGRGPAVAGRRLGPGRRPRHRRRPGRAPRPGRHAGTALPD